MPLTATLTDLSFILSQVQAPMQGPSSGGGDLFAGIFGLLFCCGIFFVSIGLLAFWIWMLVDCCTREFPGSNDKVVWILVIVLASWLGALIYYFVGRPKGKKV